MWFGLYGSKINLVCIAIERYVMIVHPVWHRNKFRSWMLYVVLVISWVASSAWCHIVTSLTTQVNNGECLWGATWPSTFAKNVYAVGYFIFCFVLVLASFIYCYGNIIVVIRRQARVFAAQQANKHVAGTSANNNLSNMRYQTNAVKLMITVSVAFILCWLPCDLYVSLSLIYTDMNFLTEVYFTTVFVAYFNICLNPFIYATKYDLVRNYLRQLIRCCRKDDVNNSTAISVKAVQPTANADLN